jgi:hypothetical protein
MGYGTYPNVIMVEYVGQDGGVTALAIAITNTSAHCARQVLGRLKGRSHSQLDVGLSVTSLKYDGLQCGSHWRCMHVL